MQMRQKSMLEDFTTIYLNNFYYKNKYNFEYLKTTKMLKERTVHHFFSCN